MPDSRQNTANRETSRHSRTHVVENGQTIPATGDSERDCNRNHLTSGRCVAAASGLGFRSGWNLDRCRCQAATCNCHEHPSAVWSSIATGKAYTNTASVFMDTSIMLRAGQSHARLVIVTLSPITCHAMYIVDAVNTRAFDLAPVVSLSSQPYCLILPSWSPALLSQLQYQPSW